MYNIAIISLIFLSLYPLITGITCTIKNKFKKLDDASNMVILISSITILLGIVGLYLKNILFSIIYCILSTFFLIFSTMGLDAC